MTPLSSPSRTKGRELLKNGPLVDLGIRLPKDKKFLWELPSKEIKKRNDKAILNLIDGLKVLDDREVDLERRLADSEKTQDKTMRVHMSYSKKNKALTKVLQEVKERAAKDQFEVTQLRSELVAKRKRAEEKQPRLSADLDAKKRRSDDAISANLCLETNIIILSGTKLEMTLWEYHHWANVAEAKLKTSTWKLQELEATIP
ncbi:hypothetical protein NE237_019780 [Protea cynaroides]|uniref:Uncharacterized protein n=1 Tax=Protea cynaroides TaxID=273540 RepID=A0A9Q0K2U4_9MAGN|nr:hypothetical protein NE237_019780 [Protea cynaroides]